MTTDIVSADSLRAQWREVRNKFKVDDYKLKPSEVAGLLIEELGSAFAALRLVVVSQDAPFLVALKNPKSKDWREVRDLLIAAWLGESGQQRPTEESLREAWEHRPDDFAIGDCTDATVLAGALLSRYSLDQAIQDLGLSLYSTFHEATGFAEHPLAREVLFMLDMVARDEPKDEFDED